MTNREWLNSLSDEELADIMVEDGLCSFCIYFCKCAPSDGDCLKAVLKWLKTEHKEDENDTE